MVRAARSVTMRNDAPKSNDKGSTERKLSPVKSRTVWGTMMPTNPIRPDTATTAAEARVAAATTSRRTLLTGTPKDCASISPTDKVSSSRR